MKIAYITVTWLSLGLISAIVLSPQPKPTFNDRFEAANNSQSFEWMRPFLTK